MKFQGLKIFFTLLNRRYYQLFGPLVFCFALTFDKYSIGWLFLFLLIVISFSKFIEIISFK